MDNFDLKKYLAEGKLLKEGNMKTPMQELLEWVRATLPMDLETPQMIEEKIESMLEKEKEVMCGFATNFVEYECFASFEGEVNCDLSTEEYFDKTFNTK